MTIGRLGWAGLLGVAALGLWLLLGSGRVFGHDIGGLGMTLLVAATWVALYGVSAVPQGEFERGIAPGEWRAWIGVAFLSMAAVYFFAKLPLMVAEALPQAPHASAVARNLVLLLIAWTVLSQVMAARWKGRVREDERDREIERRGGSWGHGTLVFGLFALAVTLGLSPPERLQWATPFLIGNLLILTLMLGWLVESAATAAMYWRDRRQVAG